MSFLEETWKLKARKVEKGGRKNWPQGTGLYFLFCYREETNKNPFYVGMTGFNFKNRNDEHFSNDGTIDILEKEKKDIHVIMYTKEMPEAVAKLLESVFLLSFDFAMNSKENEKKRPDFELESPISPNNDGCKRFSECFEFLHNSLNKIIEIDAMKEAFGVNGTN